MKSSFRELHDRFREALTQLLWDQWSLLGMAGNVRSSRSVPFVIDPEALLLATTRFARHEPRFLVEVLDWLTANGRSLVSQRIRNLQAGYHYGCVPVLLEFDERLCQARPRDWKSLRSLADSQHEKQPELALPDDPELRGMSARPNPERTEACIFKLRSLFGGSARAEVLAWLLTHDRGYPAEIAKETGWNAKSIQQILNDLEGSGLVYAERREREKPFALDRDHWIRWLRPDADGRARRELHWQNQPALYLGCYYVERILGSLLSREETASENLQSISIREGMSERIAREVGSMTIAFERADFGFLFQGHAGRSGGDLVKLFHDGVECLTAALDREGRRGTVL